MIRARAPRRVVRDSDSSVGSGDGSEVGSGVFEGFGDFEGSGSSVGSGDGSEVGSGSGEGSLDGDGGGCGSFDGSAEGSEEGSGSAVGEGTSLPVGDGSSEAVGDGSGGVVVPPSPDGGSDRGPEKGRVSEFAEVPSPPKLRSSPTTGNTAESGDAPPSRSTRDVVASFAFSRSSGRGASVGMGASFAAASSSVARPATHGTLASPSTARRLTNASSAAIPTAAKRKIVPSWIPRSFQNE
jgi:hypothetical protein